MLSSSGCFRGLSCPFLGRCQRAHCHFNHTGSLPSAQGAPAITLEKYHDQPVSLEAACSKLEMEKVTKTIEVIETEMEQQQQRLLMCQSSCEHGSHNLVTQKNSETSSPPSTGKPSLSCTKCKSIVPVSECSSHKHMLLALGEEDASQNIAVADSIINTACSGKHMIDHCKPSTDLEYDPLINYSSNLKPICKNYDIEKKQESKAAFEQSPEVKHSLASETVRNFPSFEAEVSSEDELVIDVPNLHPLSPNPRGHWEFRRKGNDDLNLIRKVKQPNTEEPINVVLAMGKTVNNIADLGLENDCRNTELNVSALQRKQILNPAKCNKFSNVTNSPINKISFHQDNINLGSKVKRKGELLNSRIQVQVENSIASINAKWPNQICKQEYVPENPGMSVQKCGKAKEQNSIHWNTLQLSDYTEQLSESGSQSLKALAKVRCNGLEATNASSTNKFGENVRIDQAGIKAPNKVGNIFLKNSDGRLHPASDKGDESSHSDEELSSAASDNLEFTDSDTMEECLRIFNEFSKQEIKTNKPEIEQDSVANLPDSVSAASAHTRQKKRIAHVAKFKGKSNSNQVIIPHTLPAPKLRCRSRIKQVQQQAVQLMSNVKGGQVYKSTVSDCPAQKRLLVQSSKPQTASTVKAVSRYTFRKNPGAASISRSNVPLTEGKALYSTSKADHNVMLLGTPSSVPVIQRRHSKQRSKVSSTVRKRYLGYFIEEFLKTSSSRQEAVNKAVSEEKTIFEHSTSRFMYLNVAVHTLKMLNNLGNQDPVLFDGQHPGKRNRSSSGKTLEGAALYIALKGYVLNEEQLKNGYPHSRNDKLGRAVLLNGEAKKCIADSLIQVCCRCGISFSVTPEGNYISKEECVHHWGRLIKQQGPGGWECRYSCCEALLESAGCQVAKLHVYKQKENLDGFVKTYLKLLPLDGNPGIYAVNSEVCYTNQGAELVRASVVNSNLEVIYDEFVKPDNEVIDYNTRFSGVSHEDLLNTETTLGEVQAALLRILSADSILIGHGLDKDLLALKIIHSVVIDTLFVFPHRFGQSDKQQLLSEYLHTFTKSTQGFGSVEKARACMELVLWEVKEATKSRKW
ncbi:RNA exonuclease 1 homolog isoform X2 [Narcine bancroftii]|uniref:RNA exonuclease 1 homolog isoform X2 n=1 Tax=Narcine bancroftii TaxID=1343680 RepID=UPI0038318413